MHQNYFLVGLAAIAGLASAQRVVEYTTVGTSTFANIKFFPTNCQNQYTGQHTNEFWTYLQPSTTANTNPDFKHYADTTGQLTWEGSQNIYVTDDINDRLQVLLNVNAHSQPATHLVGALYSAQYKSYSPCYVTPPEEMLVDFGNGWVCNRLYTCSPIPHVVTSLIVSKGHITIDVSQGPYETLMHGLMGQLPAASGQIALIPTYEQTFTDNEGNSYNFVVEVTNNGPYNLFWTVQAATQYPPVSIYNQVPTNPAASFFDQVYQNGVMSGDALFPQSAAIVSYVGLDHTAYSKINFFQTSVSPAPATSSTCNTQALGVSGGYSGIIAGIIGALAAVVAPETGGISLAIAAGVAGAASGALGIAQTVAC